MHRWFRCLDPLFGLTLAASLLMVLATAWPGSAAAAERLVGNGERASEQRQLAEFEAVQTTGPQVLVRQGAAQSVSVQADRNLLPLLETVVEDSRQGKTLVLRWKPGISIKTTVLPLVSVTLPRLSALLVSGSGDIVAEQIQSPRLLARVVGAGDIQLKALQVETLNIEIKGSGDVQASGQAGRLAVAIAGSGDVKTSELKAEVVTVTIAGSGDASVHAERTLEVSIAGSGDVVYSGNAAVKQSIAGSGGVKRR